MEISKGTLEFCDQLIDGVTLSAQAPNFAEVAVIIAKAKEEVAEALIDAGGVPLSVQRNS